jgi:hypothetical protein
MIIATSMGYVAHARWYLNSLSDPEQCSSGARQKVCQSGNVKVLIADVREGIGPGMAESIYAAMGSVATLLV